MYIIIIQNVKYHRNKLKHEMEVNFFFFQIDKKKK